MKRIISSIAVVAIFLAGCVFPIVDTRVPTPAPTAWEGGPPQATQEAEAIATDVADVIDEEEGQMDCNIKANLSNTGERIYHIPGGAYYNHVRIDLSRGEFYACSEQQAQELGWRAARR